MNFKIYITTVLVFGTMLAIASPRFLSQAEALQVIQSVQGVK